ncbi:MULTISPECIES: fimbrial biogenesis chaperone [Citrobacter]|nr:MULTISPECIES: molecular chaperone [Citrobacter]
MMSQTTVNRMKKAAGIAVLTGVWILPADAAAAVRPALTRIVAYAADKETAIEVKNESQESYLVQSWLEDLKGNENNLPLVLTPPVMKVGGGQDGRLRLVVLPAEIPQDRESAYWLSIQEIPPKAKDSKDNKLIIAIRNRLKVFVRPAGLKGEASEAVKSLRWTVEDGGSCLKADNPTPYHVSFGRLELKAGGGAGVTPEDRIEMTLPLGSRCYTVPERLKGKRATLTYSAMNDYGGETDVLTTEVQL